MLHLNVNDDRPNSMENFRELAENKYYDVFVTYLGKEYIVYSDPGSNSISPESGDTLCFRSFEELIKAPVFEGKTLEEIIDEIDATY